MKMKRWRWGPQVCPARASPVARFPPSLWRRRNAINAPLPPRHMCMCHAAAVPPRAQLGWWWVGGDLAVMQPRSLPHKSHTSHKGCSYRCTRLINHTKYVSNTSRSNLGDLSWCGKFRTCLKAIRLGGMFYRPKLKRGSWVAWHFCLALPGSCSAK